jgi:PPOX class probable F420-dependent enzyme
MTEDEARRRLAGARVARLGTQGLEGRPHLVPVVFALRGDTVYSAVDHKPKRSAQLARLANVARHQAACLLADHYEDADWDALWWVRADGRGRVLQPEDPEAAEAVALLIERYSQYRDRPPHGPVLALDVHTWRGWAAAG